jgi:hypothetical protein
VTLVSAAVLVGAGSVWATDGAAVEVAR